MALQQKLSLGRGIVWGTEMHIEALGCLCCPGGQRAVGLIHLPITACQKNMDFLLFILELPVPGWLGKHPKHKLFMIQSSLLESQTWGRFKIKDIKPTALNCVRHPLTLLSVSHLVPPGQHLSGCWYLPAFPALWGSLPSLPALG